MHGELTVTKYMSLSLDCSIQIKDHEQEFEKFYFVSMVSWVQSSNSSLALSLIHPSVQSLCPAPMYLSISSPLTTLTLERCLH